MITIIHGPAATGKTRHKQAFAAHYGCTHVVDGWNPNRDEVPDDGRLVLTSATTEAIRAAIRLDCPEADVRVIDITTARQSIGLAPHAPGIAERLAR
jgi:hypothetical protein